MRNETTLSQLKRGIKEPLKSPIYTNKILYMFNASLEGINEYDGEPFVNHSSNCQMI